MIDIYSLKARVYPMVIFFLPLLILGVSYSLEYKSILQLVSAFGLTSVLIYLLSNLGRDSGKKKESRLWDKWGGMPSIQLLHFGNSTIDQLTKKNYHKILLNVSPIENVPDFEGSSLDEVADIYKSWTKFIITNTRDTKRFPLLFRENISYGFRRNLWGLKPISLLFLLIAIALNYIIQGYLNGFFLVRNFSTEFVISESILIMLFLLWILVINSNWIKIPAFAYAERLLESLETIKKDL